MMDAIARHTPVKFFNTTTRLGIGVGYVDSSYRASVSEEMVYCVLKVVGGNHHFHAAPAANVTAISQREMDDFRPAPAAPASVLEKQCNRCGVPADETPEGMLAYNGSRLVCSACDRDLNDEWVSDNPGSIHPLDTLLAR